MQSTIQTVIAPLVFFVTKRVFYFFRLCWGCFNKPYVTYRQLATYHYPFQVFLIGLLLFTHFAAAAIVKHGLHTGILNVGLLWLKTLIAVAVTFSITVGTLYVLGRIFRGKGNLLTFIKLWSFSLLPTLVWFLAAMSFYVLLPPPRTTSIPGQLFSALFLAFSAGCLLWKAILYYLSLRFGLRLGTIQIAAVTLIAVPILLSYSFLLYQNGIFKVPFI